MPLTNEYTPEPDGASYRFHVWLKHGPLPEFEDLPDAEIPALCGHVHVNHMDELRPIPEEIDTLPKGNAKHAELGAFLRRNDVCNVCADVAREELGLTTRDLVHVPGIGHTKAEALREADIDTVAQLRRLSQGDLSGVEAIGNALAARIKADVGSEEDVVRPEGERPRRK